MPNVVALASAGLAVAAGAGMTFIISTETFAVATLGGDDSCELGTLGVFTSSYTPGCDPSKPGDAFTGAETLTFWPLFATQNNFGGAFESLGIDALEEGTIPEGFPDEFDCQTEVSADIDTFSAATNGIWDSVDAALPGAVAAVINAPDPSQPPSVSNQDLGFQLQGAVGNVATATFQTVFASSPVDFTTLVPATFAATVSGTTGALNCGGTAAQRYPVAAACQYMETFSALAGAGGPCEDTGTNPWAICFFAIGAANVPRTVAMSELGPTGSFGGLKGSFPADTIAVATSSHLARWNEYVLVPLQGAIDAETDPVAKLDLLTQKATLELGVGILQGCQQFGDGTIDECIDANGLVNPGAALPNSAASLTVIPADLRAPYFLGCLLTGTNGSDPLMGIPPSASAPAGAGCMGSGDSTTGSGYASAFEVFGRFEAAEVLQIPGLDPSAAALLGSIDTFAALLGGCEVASASFVALEAGWQQILATTGRTEAQFVSSFVANTHVDNAALSAFCAAALGEHTLVDANGDAPADDTAWATFVTNGACGYDITASGLLSDGAAQKVRCKGGTASFGLPKQVFEGVYSLDPIKQLSIEYATQPAKATEINKKFILDAVVPKCNDDTEDAQAIANAQTLTPIATGLVFTGAAVGIVVTLAPVPPMVMLLPGVITIVGAVIFTLALLGVRNAPVYSLIGQPCPDGNTCYAAGTGNKMALPAIAVGLLSGIGLCVSAFVGNGNSEDYSSFKETQVGAKA